MIDFTKAKDVITVLPLLIIYILPGYVFIGVKNFITNRKQVDDKSIALKSIVISYVIINFERVFAAHFFKFNVDISSSRIIIVTFFFSIIIAYIYSMLLHWDFIRKIFKILGITRSLKSDTLVDIVDFKLGMWVRVFLNSEEIIYVGKIRKFEQITEDIFYIVLSNFVTYNYKNKKLVDNENDNTEWVLICVKDNYRIELVYDANSKKIID